MAKRVWLVAGPGDRKWSIWDFGDEMTVHEGPGLLDRVMARVPEALCRRLTDGDRRFHMESAAGSIHVAKLLGSDNPIWYHLWR